MGANQNNVNKILERAGAATAASAVPVSGASNKNSANTQRGANPNRVSDILTRAGANQNRVSDILTRAGAKPVEPEWQAAMFGGTPRYTLSDERYKGILDVDESTGKISVNANAAQTAQELLRQNRELYNSATDEAQKKLYGENMDIYRGVLADLGVEEEGNRLDFGQGLGYAVQKFGVGAVQDIGKVANDLGYKAQANAAEDYIMNAIEADKYNGGKAARAALDEYLAGLTQNERDALEITGQLPSGEQLLYEKVKKEADEKYKDLQDNPVQASHLGEKWAQDIQNRYGNVAGVWGTAGEVMENVGGQAPAAVIRMTGNKYLADAWFYSSASGAATQEALADGTKLDDALVYGSVEGIKELATEKMFDGLGGLLGAGAMDDITEGLIGRMSKNPTVQKGLRLAIGLAGEGAEDVVGDLVDPFIRAITLDKDLKEELDAVTLESLWHTFSISALSALVMSGTSAGIQTVKKTTGLTTATENDIKNAALQSETVQKALNEFRETKTGKNLIAYWKAIGAEGDAQSAAAAQNTAEMRARKALARAGIEDLTAMEELGFTPTQINTIRAETKIKDAGELQAVLTALKAMEGTKKTAVQDGIPAPEVDLGPSLNYDGIPAPRVALAGEEIGPDTRPLTMNNAPAGAEAMNEGGIQNGNQMGNDSAERMDLQRAGGESGESAGGMAEAAGADQRGKAEERRVRAVDLPEQGSRDLIEIGTDSPKIKVLPETMWDDELREAYAQAEAKGLEMIPVVGELEGYDHGTIVTGNAVIVGNRIIVQADNADWGVMQLIEHEIGHSEENEELNAQTRAEILNRYSEEEFTEIFNTYKAMLPGYTQEEILSEIIQNARAGMNAFGKDVTQYRETVRETYDRALSKSGQEQENGTKETRGPTEWSRGGSEQTITENVVVLNDGSKAVNINSQKTFLKGHRKGEWGRLIAEHIQKTLVGKKIITEDGDIIRVTGRAPGEVAYGTNSAELYEAAKNSGDYAGISAKQKAATKAAAIISVSKFERWGDNVKESKTNDQFSADGFNYRKAQVIIDGVPYSATVVTALNYNEKSKDYGEKFYDITDVYEIESPELSAKLRDGENAMSPYKIQIKADHSGDVLSVAQKQRAVKGENVGYVSGDTAGKTAAQIALEKAVEAAGGKITWSRGGENLLTEEGPEETASNTEMPTSTTEMPTSTTEMPEAKQQAEAKAAMYETADAMAESGIEESVDVEDLLPEERPDKLTAKLFGIDIEKEQEAEVKSKAIEDMEKILEEYPTPFDMYAEQSPIKKDPGEPTDPTEGKVQTKVEQEKKTPGQKLRDFWRGFRREMVNAGEAVHRAIKVNGDTALDGYYFNAMASRSRAGNWVTNQRMSYDLQQSGKSLNEILDPIRKKGEEYYEAFQIYLLHKLNVERMSRDRGYDLREAQRQLTAFVNQNADIAAMSREDLRYYAGMILEEGDEGYPLKKAKRELANEYLELIAARDEAAAAQNKPVFGYEVTAEMSLEKARMAEIDHPEFKEMAEEVYAYSRDLLQYRVDAGLISQEDMDKLTEQYPHYIPVFYDSEGTEQKIHSGGVTVSTAIKRARGGDGKILPLHTALARQTSTVMHNVGMNDFGKRLMFNVEMDRDGMKPFVTNIEETPVRWETDFARNDDVLQPHENVISIIQDGKRYDLTLTKEMAAAFQMMKPGQENNAAIEAIGKATNIFKALCTSYSPTFMLTNPIRDVQDALFYTKDTKAWVENYPQAWKEIAKSGKYWQMYKAMGGVYGSYFDWLTGESTEGKSKVLNKIEQMNMWIEQAPRLAEFMATVKKAEVDGKVSQDVLMEAFHNAQEITTNFGQSGGKTSKTLNKIVPFWNAGVQGADKFFRTVTEKKSFAAWGSLVLKAAAFGMLPEILNGLLYRKDEEWDIIDDEMKVNYYLFKGRDGNWIKIPKGRVLATLSTPVVGAMEGMRGDKVDWGDLGKAALGNIAPNNPLDTNIFSTAVQAQLFDKDDPGKNWYGGDIESKRLQNYAPGERYDESTDVISKWIGGKLNLSPKKINYIIDQYSGVIGDLILPMLTPRAEAGLYIGNYREPLLSMFVSRFTTDTVRSNDISDGYYDLLDQLGYAAKAGDDNAKIAEKFMNAAGSEISDLYAQIREIENDTELTGKEKTELTRELRKQLNKLQKDITEEAERYLDAAGDFLDERPDLDYTDEATVRAWMEAYNAEQTAPTARLTAEQAQKKMEAEVYRELNRQQFGAEYALEKYNGDVYEKAQELNEESGVDFEAFYDYYFGKSALRDDKDAQGRTISGTKMEKVVKLIDGLDIPDEQKDALYYDAGYSDSKIYNTPWHGGDGSFAKANKEWEVAEDEEKSDAWVQSYLTSRPEIDYTDTATVRAWMEQYNAEQSSEEYWTDLAGAASKMRAEVEREANKAMYGADYALHKYSEDVWEKAQGLNVNYQLAYEDYYDFYFQSLKCYSDKDENGKSISGSKKAKIVDLIDSMAVTDDQKDGLFLAAGYTESGLKGTPWHGGKSGSGGSGGGRRRRSGKSTGKKLTDSISTKAAGKTGGDGWGLTEDGRIWIEPPQIGDFDMSAMRKAQEIVDKYDDNDIWAALWSHYAKPTTETGFRL